MDEKKVLTDEEKKEYIEKLYENEQLLEDATKEQIEAYKAYVEEGIKKDWIIALYAKAYGCYGGNDVFDCDWITSRDCLLRIIELQGDEDPFIYNTLGYLYYYGRCNDKTPEYDLAFKYFSVGSANGVYESMYKIADMYIAGKGVPKSEKAGSAIILNMYEENKEIFCDGNVACKFADVALRVGGLFERGCGVEQDYEMAYYHYCEAFYAINLRKQDCDHYGDGKVLDNIRDSIRRVKEKLPKDYFKNSFSLPVPGILGSMLLESAGLDIELRLENGKYYLIANRYASEDLSESVLINIPQIEYCQLVNTLRIRMEGLDNVDALDFPQKAFINSISQGKDERTWIFSFKEIPLLEISCDEFVFYPIDNLFFD